MRYRNIYAIIPARGGSKGIPKKNIKLLAGYPLITYSIAAARLSSKISRIIVSTDSQEIGEISRYFGAEVPFLRPAEFSSDNSPDREFLLHAIDCFAKNERTIPEYLVHLRPTTPLRDPNLLGEAISLILSDSKATSLRSGHEAPESPFKWFTRDEGGYFHGMNPKDARPGYSNLPRQTFPIVYIPDGYVDVLRVSFVLNSDEIHGPHIIGYVSPRCVEVDTLEDFEYLEYQIKKKGHPLFDFLKSNYSLEG
jgi:N-acylneuraminate cytidylyltransferase